MLEVKHIINIIIRAKSAESGPPLGTVLGNLGVNTIKFVKEFNEFTEELPEYFKIKVKIVIFENNSFFFSVKAPTIGFILSLLRKEEEFLLSNGSLVKRSIFFFTDLVKLTLFKFPYMPLNKSINIILGTVYVSNTFIDFKR
jgi:hypothetical protein